MARSLNGSSDFIDCGTSAALNPGAITVAGWFKFSALTNAYTAAISRNGTGGEYQLFVKSNGKLAVYVQGSGSVSYDGTGSHTLVTGTWYHLAFTYSSAAGLTGYVNGASDGTAAANGNIASVSANFQIGKDQVNAGRLLAGTAADVAVWGAALSAGEIGALAQGVRPGRARPPTLLWLPLNGDVSPEPDISGNVLNGTLTGTSKANGPPLTLISPKWHASVPPQYPGGGARTGFANTSYLSTPAVVCAGFPCSASAWFFPTSLSYAAGNNQTIFAVGASASFISSFARLYLNSAGGASPGKLSVEGANHGNPATSSVNATLGTWNHGGFALASTTSSIVYLNGGNTGTNGGTNSFPGSLDTTTIGNELQTTAAFPFSGPIGEVCAWNVALTAAEFAALATGVRARLIRRGNIIGWWPMFGQPSMLAEPDQSGFGNNMTIVGSLSPAPGPPITLLTSKSRTPPDSFTPAAIFIPPPHRFRTVSRERLIRR